MGLAVLSYAQDYDECLPNWAMAAGGPYWDVLVLPYVKNEQIFGCPSKVMTYVDPNGGTQVFTLSYGWNQLYVGGGALYSGGPGSALGSIQAPSQTLVIADAGGGVTGWAGCTAYGELSPSLAPPQQSAGSGQQRRVCADRHNNGANVGFVDGHAKWLSGMTDGLVTGSDNLLFSLTAR